MHFKVEDVEHLKVWERVKDDLTWADPNHESARDILDLLSGCRAAYGQAITDAAMVTRSDQETNVIAGHCNFYKVEKWTKDGTKAAACSRRDRPG